MGGSTVPQEFLPAAEAKAPGCGAGDPWPGCANPGQLSRDPVWPYGKEVRYYGLVFQQGELGCGVRPGEREGYESGDLARVLGKHLQQFITSPCEHRVQGCSAFAVLLCQWGFLTCCSNNRVFPPLFL